MGYKPIIFDAPQTCNGKIEKQYKPSYNYIFIPNGTLIKEVKIGKPVYIYNWLKKNSKGPYSIKDKKRKVV